MPATAPSIVWPMVAQVALTALVWVCLYVARLGEMSARRIDPQSVRTSRHAAGVLENVAAADNFRNLFEVPVLFFAACCVLLATGRVGSLALDLAWAFVALRALHSLIHISYNRVLHRFAAYALSTLCVFALWAVIAFDFWRGG